MGAGVTLGLRSRKRNLDDEEEIQGWVRGVLGIRKASLRFIRTNRTGSRLVSRWKGKQRPGV